MFEILNFEEIYFCKFGNGKGEGCIYFCFDNSEIRIISGKDTDGKQIPETTIKNEIKGKINPTKVLLFIAKVLKKVLCPSCV